MPNRGTVERQSNSNENMGTIGAFFGKSCGTYSAYFEFFSKEFGHTDTRSNETFIGHELMFPIGISRLGHLQSSQQFESEY